MMRVQRRANGCGCCSTGNSTAAGLATPETKGWIGERHDADAGLQYLNARYYDPVLGLFIQPDWFEVTKPGVGTNRFSYSHNDPVNKFDPGGNEWYDDWDDFKDLFQEKEETGSDGTRVIESSPIMSAIIPGQVAWDNARTAWANDRKLEAAIHATAMVGHAIAAAAPIRTNTGAASHATPASSRAILYDVAGAGKTVFANKLDHIFENPKHNLNELLTKFGGDRLEAYIAVQSATNNLLANKDIREVY